MEAYKYIIAASRILRENSFPFLIPALIGILFHFPQYHVNSSGIAFLTPVFLLIIIYPLVFAQYSEIVLNNKQSSYFHLFKIHWLNYFCVIAIIGAPKIIFAFIGNHFKEYTVIIGSFLSISIHIISIYIIPLVFLLRKRLTSISLGIKCLLGNLVFSAPIIIVSLFPLILGLIFEPFRVSSNRTIGILIVSYLFWLISTLIDFLIFISATLIIEEKLLIRHVD